MSPAQQQVLFENTGRAMSDSRHVAKLTKPQSRRLRQMMELAQAAGIYWSDSALNFIDANGDGIVDAIASCSTNHLGNGDVNNIEPPVSP